MDKLKGYEILPTDYRGRNSLLLRKGDYDVEMLEHESKNALWYFFNTAYGTPHQSPDSHSISLLNSEHLLHTSVEACSSLEGDIHV